MNLVKIGTDAHGRDVFERVAVDPSGNVVHVPLVRDVPLESQPPLKPDWLDASAADVKAAEDYAKKRDDEERERDKDRALGGPIDRKELDRRRAERQLNPPKHREIAEAVQERMEAPLREEIRREAVLLAEQNKLVEPTAIEKAGDPGKLLEGTKLVTPEEARAALERARSETMRDDPSKAEADAMRRATERSKRDIDKPIK